MTTPRIYISAAHKSSGKTTLSLGLCAALSRLSLRIQPLKKGPDYIDPLWLGAASNATCYNLDFNTMSHGEILHLLDHKSQGKDLVLIEGNKGLYDGLDLDGSTSNAAMAKLTRAPVVLVIDAEGMTRGVAPLLLGYQDFDRDVDIAGVIFNKVGGQRHEKKLYEITRHYTDLQVLGAVHRSDDMLLAERHLGLMPYNETQKALARIATIADRVQEQVDLQRFLALAKRAPALPDYHFPAPAQTARARPHTRRLKIAILRDAAFGFYYADDLEALERQGAELIPVNALQDTRLPEVDALFIGGGFPETHMQPLSENRPLRSAIHHAIEAGLPTYAECGGLMYLSQSISWQQESYPMVGIIPVQTLMCERPQGRGYVRLQASEHMPWPQVADGTDNGSDMILAHEFHYSKLDDPQGKLLHKGTFAYDVKRGFGIDGKHDGWLYKNLLASYSHLRDTSKYRWTQRFIKFIEQVKTQQEQR